MKKEDLLKLGLDEETAIKVATAFEAELKGFTETAKLDEAKAELAALERLHSTVPTIKRA